MSRLIVALVLRALGLRLPDNAQLDAIDQHIDRVAGQDAA